MKRTAVLGQRWGLHGGTELGDETLLAPLLCAPNPSASKVGGFVAAATAQILSVSTPLAVVIGDRLGASISPRHMGLIAAVGLTAAGVWMLLPR